MWKRTEIDPERKYRVALVSNQEGWRTFELTNGKELPEGTKFITDDHVDHDLLKRRAVHEIIRRYPIRGNIKIEVDAHGIWFTEDEIVQFMRDEIPMNEIRWHDGVPPKLARK